MRIKFCEFFRLQLLFFFFGINTSFVKDLIYKEKNHFIEQFFSLKPVKNKIRYTKFGEEAFLPMPFVLNNFGSSKNL